jgi:chromosome segregation ATPase
MKNRVGLILLLVICLGLIIGLLVARKNADEQQRRDSQTILNHSNQWVETQAKLEEQVQVTTLLEKDLETQKKNYSEALLNLTNNFTMVSANLAKTEAILKSTQEEVVKRDARIQELQSQNEALDKQALDLNAAITNLTRQIADTQRKLASAEGDKAFLEMELKRLTGEKAELERQFNDLAVLRAQVAKLKEELSIARRLEWIRQGIFANTEQKGAQKLMQGVSAQPKPAKPNYDLNVEVRSDGSVKVIPPITNAPAAK